MFEHRSQPLISRRAYAHRLVRSAIAGLLLVLPSLAVGMLGYRGLEHLSWTDAFLDSAMLLGGMGPVHQPVTEAGKIFAGLYAIYCGLLVLMVASIMLAPMVHRAMHRFHLESEADAGEGPRKPRHGG